MARIDVISLEVVKDRTITTPYTKNIGNPQQAGDIFREFIGKKSEEYFVIACLNNKNSINSIAVISKGTINSSLVHPREVFKYAISTNAVSILLGHNHPSLDILSPSKEDINVTERLVQVGKLVGIEVLDHIIVNDIDYISLKNLGYL